MFAYTIRRVVLVVPVLVLASIVVWAVTYTLPGSAATAIAGEYATQEQIEAVEQRLGLDRHPAIQYMTWLGHASTGDLGDSSFSGQPVTSLVSSRLGATVQLALLGLLCGLLIAVPAGIVAALRPRSWAARIVYAYEAAGLAVPTFWLGILLILLFNQQLDWLPALSNHIPLWIDPIGALRYLALPALTLGLHVAAVTARFLTSALRESLRQDFVRTARAKGISEREVIRRHALPNALISTVTVVGLQLGAFLGGAVVVEVVFNYPGLGRLIYNAVASRDYPLVQGAVLFVIVSFLLVNLIVDLLYAWLDPRVRLN